MSWGPLEELGALFSPGMRHEQERREKLAVLREDEGNSADPPSTVDLDRGIAVLRLPKSGAGADAAGQPTAPPARPATARQRATPQPTTPQRATPQPTTQPDAATSAAPEATPTVSRSRPTATRGRPSATRSRPRPDRAAPPAPAPASGDSPAGRTD